MELQDYLKVLIKRWRSIALFPLLLGCAAVAVAALMPKTYEAQSQLLVSASSRSTDSGELLQGSTFIQERVKSYAEAIRSPLVLDPVIQQLGLQTSADELASKLQVEVPLDTVIINVAATDQQPRTAQAIASTTAHQFVSLIPRIEDTGTSASPVKVTILRSGTLNPDPVGLSKKLAAAGGILIGLLIGLAFAAARELLDTRVRTEDDVRRFTHQSVVLGTIPFYRNATKEPVIVESDPHSPRAEAFRSLRTNLQFVQATAPIKSIVVTSSVPGEGKSTTTANLAITLAQGGSRVCMVEADLRRPRLLQYMGLAEGAGLTNLLLGDAEYDDVLQPNTGGQLVVLGAGPIPPNPSELLGSPAMQGIIDELTSQFDFVIFDAPPLLPVTDAAVLSRATDGIVVVAGADVVRKEQLKRTVTMLEAVDANLLGVVINRARTKGSDAYGYFREGYDSDPVYDPRAPRTTTKARSVRLEH